MKILITEDQLNLLVKKINKTSLIKEIYENNTLVIGDSIGYFLSQKLNLPNNMFLNSISEQIYTTKDLLNDLVESDEIRNDIKNIIVSIGSEDLFSEQSYIKNLCELIYEIFPNAEYFIIEGFLPSQITEKLEEKQKVDLEFVRESYYDKFPKDKFNIIDSGDLISREKLDIDSSKISFILNQLLRVLNLNTDELDLQDKEISKNTNKKEFLNNDVFKYVDLNLDDREKYDEVDEFFTALKLMIKSNNIYNIKLTNADKGDVELIQTTLKLLDLPYSDKIEVNGKFDNATRKTVEEFQKIKGIDVNGVVDSELLEILLYDLENKGFDEDKLKEFLDLDFDIEEDLQTPNTNGIVKIVNLGGERESNANLMIDYMIEKNIVNPFTQIGILSVIGKESGFIPQNEICYDGTPNDRIRKIFGSCRLGKYNDTELTILKKDCVKFFDAVYGKEASPCFNFNTGNDKVGDGYKYRGRGFNGITFKTIYKQIGDYIGEDLVSDPEKLNDLDVAAKAAVAYFTKGKDGGSLPEFNNTEEAINYFVDLNAGGNAMSETRQNAFNVSGHFEVE